MWPWLLPPCDNRTAFHTPSSEFDASLTECREWRTTLLLPSRHVIVFCKYICPCHHRHVCRRHHRHQRHRFLSFIIHHHPPPPPHHPPHHPPPRPPPIIIIIIIIKVLVLSSHHRYPWQFFNCNGPFNSLNYMGTDHGPSVWILLGVGMSLFKSSGAGAWTATTTVGTGLFDFYRLALLRSLTAFKRNKQNALDLMHDLGHLNSRCFFFSDFIRKNDFLGTATS